MSTTVTTITKADEHALRREPPPRCISIAQHNPSSSARAMCVLERQKLRPSKSLLLKLPAEVRNVVYAELFTSESQRIRPDYALPGLLTACKQTFSEALGLYYSSSVFRCLDEDSAVKWLTRLPKEHLDLISEVRYDTRWIIFATPMIPVPGAECQLVQSLIKRLRENGFAVDQLGQKVDIKGNLTGEGKLKVSYYGRGSEGTGVKWTDKPGLIEDVRANSRA